MSMSDCRLQKLFIYLRSDDFRHTAWNEYDRYREKRSYFNSFIIK